MIAFKPLHSIYLLFVIGVIGFSCTYTTTVPKNPVFTISLDSIAANIGATITEFEEMSVTGNTETKNGKKADRMEIEILNPKNVAEHQNERLEMDKQIAQKFKQALKDPKQFNIIQVKLVVRKTSKGTLGNVEKTNSESNEFKVEDL